MNNLLLFGCAVALLVGCASIDEVERESTFFPVLGIENGMTPDEVAAELPSEAEVISRVDEADMAQMTIVLNGRKRNLWFPNGQLIGVQGK